MVDLKEPEHGADTLKVERFTDGAKIYVYDYNLITIEQAELANEVILFKLEQADREPSSFNEVIRSRGAEWRTICASYLLREEKKGNILPFNLGVVEQTEQFAKNLTMADYERLKRCIESFFTSIGKQSLLLALHRRERAVNINKLLSKVMMSSPQLNADASS